MQYSCGRHTITNEINFLSCLKYWEERNKSEQANGSVTFKLPYCFA